MEMSELAGIIGHLDGELVAGTHFLGELHSRTAAVGLDTLDDETALALVAKFEGRSDGLFITRAPTVDGGVGDDEFLG